MRLPIETIFLEQILTDRDTCFVLFCFVFFLPKQLCLDDELGKDQADGDDNYDDDETDCGDYAEKRDLGHIANNHIFRTGA